MKDKIITLAALLILGLMLGTLLDGAKAQINFMNEKHEWQTIRPGEVGQVLQSDGAGGWHWIAQEPPHALPRNSEVTISASRLTCEEGWTLVTDGMHPMCAHELKEPK